MFVRRAASARLPSAGRSRPTGVPVPHPETRVVLQLPVFPRNDRGSQVALYRQRRRHAREGGTMTMEKILVPLDGSDLAEAALETAIDILKEHPATTLLLLRAAELPRASGADPWT